MAGGLMNIKAYGNQNIILNGNPSKTFFKSTYAKYTNFGMQKFRLDFDGLRTLHMTRSSVFNFGVKRYGDILMDTFLVLNLPHIWSPVYPVTDGTSSTSDPEYATRMWQPYEFKWIKNIGTQMIESVRFTVGGQVIQEFTGQYLYNLVERGFVEGKKDLYYKMTGNVNDLNAPEVEQGGYPSTFVGNDTTDPEFTDIYNKVNSEPSIRGRQIYVPLNIWFTLASKMGFPLTSLQYAELNIEVTIRPVQELFTVNEIITEDNVVFVQNTIQPNFNNALYGMYRFLQPPPLINIDDDSIYTDRRTNWNADIHLISTYAFLTETEKNLFALKDQQYIVNQAYTTTFENVVGTKKLDLKSLGMVSSWMWYLQRNDIAMRNEWSNYTNWPYGVKPYPAQPATSNNCSNIMTVEGKKIYPGEGSQTNLYTTGYFRPQNAKEIMTTWGLLLDGKYRENEQQPGVLNYIEKYTRTSGNAPDGLYCYSFSVNNNPFDFQPSGALNTSMFSSIEFEVTTIQPTLDPTAQFWSICAPDGTVVGTQMPAWGIYEYTYNLVIMEERINILTIKNGNAGLEYAR